MIYIFNILSFKDIFVMQKSIIANMSTRFIIQGFYYQHKIWTVLVVLTRFRNVTLAVASLLLLYFVLFIRRGSNFIFLLYHIPPVFINSFEFQ